VSLLYPCVGISLPTVLSLNFLIRVLSLKCLAHKLLTQKQFSVHSARTFKASLVNHMTVVVKLSLLYSYEFCA